MFLLRVGQSNGKDIRMGVQITTGHQSCHFHGHQIAVHFSPRLFPVLRPDSTTPPIRCLANYHPMGTGHCNIPGNELADLAAKEASKSPGLRSTTNRYPILARVRTFVTRPTDHTQENESIVWGTLEGTGCTDQIPPRPVLIGKTKGRPVHRPEVILLL